MVEGISLIVKGFVCWYCKPIAFLHPCSFRSSTRGKLSRVVGDVESRRFLELYLQIAVVGDIELYCILCTEAVGRRVRGLVCRGDFKLLAIAVGFIKVYNPPSSLV